MKPIFLNPIVKAVAKTILFCASFLVLLISLSFSNSLVSHEFARLSYGVLGVIAALLTTTVFLRIDRLSFSAIGFIFNGATIKSFIQGSFIGILIMGLLSYGVIAAAGFKIVLNTENSFSKFFLGAIPILLLAYMEEIAFRGYPLYLLKDKLGARSNLLFTSLLFSLYHIANGWAIQDAFLGPGSWGLIFGLAALYTNGIAMPTGIHFAVNLTTSAFGVSGNSFNIWILRQKNGASLIDYKSSALATLIPQICVLVLAIILMEIYVRKKM